MEQRNRLYSAKTEDFWTFWRIMGAVYTVQRPRTSGHSEKQRNCLYRAKTEDFWTFWRSMGAVYTVQRPRTSGHSEKKRNHLYSAKTENFWTFWRSIGAVCTEQRLRTSEHSEGAWEPFVQSKDWELLKILKEHGSCLYRAKTENFWTFWEV